MHILILFHDCLKLFRFSYWSPGPQDPTGYTYGAASGDYSIESYNKVTIVKSEVNSGGCAGTGCFEIKIRTDEH